VLIGIFCAFSFELYEVCSPPPPNVSGISHTYSENPNIFIYSINNGRIKLALVVVRYLMLPLWTAFKL
jgi:hypothetical protein